MLHIHSFPAWQRGILALCLLTLLSQAFFLRLHAQTSTDPIPLALYQEKLVAWQAALDQTSDDATVTAIQAEMAAIRQVTLPSGAVITLQPLLGEAEAEAEEMDRTTAQRRLAIVADELAAASTDETAARLLLLTAIWQRPEFVQHDSLWQRFWRWLRSWLPAMENNNNAAPAAAPWFAWLGWGLIGVGAILLIWLFSYWLQSLFGSFVGGRERQPTASDGSIPPTAAAARANAHKLADAGSYRDAVRQLYLSAILALHERNLLTYQQSDTNREVLLAARNQPRLHQQLQPVVATFDDVWYGIHEPDRAAFDSYVSAVEKLEKLEKLGEVQ